MNKIININNDNYIDILENNRENLLLIEFWANWCSPCLSMAEDIEELSKQYNNSLIIIKAEIEKNDILVEKFKINSIPTILIIKKNKILEKISGAINGKELNKIIKNFL